ncbi:MAG: excisionase family DNA-binding protein [Umezawaea sp.]
MTTSATGHPGGHPQPPPGAPDRPPPARLAVKIAPAVELSGLLQADGSVTVPAAIAGDTLRRLVRDMVTEARTTGGQPSPDSRRLLNALYEAAQQHQNEPARPVDLAAPAEGISVREAADRMGCSTAYVRQLLAVGRLPGHKSGGVWIVHKGGRVAESQAGQRSS